MIVCDPTTCSTSFAPALSWFILAVTWIVGFLTAAFAEPVRVWLLRPRLRVSFTGAEDCITKTPTVIGSGAVYVRLKVVNETRRIARSCRAFLVKVETRTEQGTFNDTLYADSIQLAWSCQVPGSAGRSIDLIHGVSQYVDVIATNERNNDFAPQIEPLPLRYGPLFSGAPQTFRLTVQVSGDGLDAQRFRLIFQWRGKWDAVDAYEDDSPADRAAHRAESQTAPD
jgi:hypothetical protein